MPILDFNAYNGDDLYNNCKKHDFTKYIRPDQTLKVEVSLSGNGPFNNSIFVAQRIKDVVVDQFNNKFGKRPSVDLEAPDLYLVARVRGSEVSLAVDTSGVSLAHRGYRLDQGMAPLREHLAAGLLLRTGWTGEGLLYDPMCGSGTFLIEAELIRQRVSPGISRHNFAFQKMINFDSGAFDQVVEELMGLERETEGSVSTFGSDQDPRAISASQANIERAGMSDSIGLKQISLHDCQPLGGASSKGLIVVNPPYGERLSNSRDLEELYRLLGNQLKAHFRGWEAWILSGNPDLTSFLGMKSEKSYTVFNGNLECRWLKYAIRD